MGLVSLVVSVDNEQNTRTVIRIEIRQELKKLIVND